MRENAGEKGEKIKVLIVTGYSILSEALSAVLEKSDEILVPVRAEDEFEAVDLIREHKPDVVLLQPSSLKRDGIETVSQISNLRCDTKILILPMEITERVALRMLSVGARGLLSKNATSTELTSAVRTLYHGNLYLTPDIQRACAERYLLPREYHAPEDQLSDREFQVMRLLALGHTNREIATKLSVSIRTVDTHRGNLLKKLGLRNNSDITRFAIQNKIISC